MFSLNACAEIFSVITVIAVSCLFKKLRMWYDKFCEYFFAISGMPGVVRVFFMDFI